MKFGYARVSTKTQIEGNSLEQQREELISSGAEIVIEEQFTGTTTQRPEFDKLLNDLKSGDTLLVTKLDRFARSTIDGLNTINKLLEKGVKVHILNIGVMDATPASALIRTIFLAFAQFERDMIVERTQEGKAIAKMKPGYTEGRRKKFTPTQLDYAIFLLQTNSYPQVEKMTQISKSTLIREIRKRKAKGEFENGNIR